MSNVIMSRRVKVEPPKFALDMSIREFAGKRNTVLIVRNTGGLGDILMHRMMFEDFKLIMPDCKIHFACPKVYHPALIDHPLIDEILDSETVDKSKYIISYNTSTACTRYEMGKAPLSGLHRSDIWAAHCGVSLTRHDMHLRLTSEEQKWGKDRIDSYRKAGEPVVGIAPVSAMDKKNLTDEQLGGLLDGLAERGLTPFGLHTNPILGFSRRDIPVAYRVSVREWMSLIAATDYMISVDTAAFHCAGGIGVPLTGIFTFADGKVYGKYFDFELVQRHRDDDPTWTCGPCYNWCNCPKTKAALKPCLTEITSEMILKSVDKMLKRWPKR
jgi:ADP-heptose:LPS heptosyltransferase